MGSTLVFCAAVERTAIMRQSNGGLALLRLQFQPLAEDLLLVDGREMLRQRIEQRRLGRLLGLQWSDGGPCDKRPPASA